MKSILSLLSILLFNSTIPVFSAENSLDRVSITPQKILLFCSKSPLGFTTQLSSNKRQITINFPNYTAADETRMSQGKGVIEDVYVKQTGKNIQVMIQLNEKKGFTAIALPYSHAVMIDIFSWDSLTKSDELYHTSLLGSEKEITPHAYQAILKSAEQKCADALFFAGIKALQSGDLDKAVSFMNSSLEYKSTIPDIYAALAQISRMKNQLDKAKRFQDEFIDKSGVRSILDIPAQYQPPLDSMLTSEPISLVYKMDEHLTVDSIPTITSHKDSTIPKLKDTTRFASIFSAPISASPAHDSQTGSLDQWMKTGAIAAIGFVVTASLYMVWLYLRWRKSKLNELIATTPPLVKFEDMLVEKTEESNRAVVQKATSLYKQGSIINHEINENISQQDNKPEEVFHLSELAHLEEPLPKEVLLQYSNYEESQELEDEETPLLGDYFPQNEVELALHLQQEGLRHKSSTLRKIASSDIPHQPYELSKVAKKFGVERNSLEVKRTLANLETDSKAMELLLSKFSGIINNHMPLVKG